MLFLHSLRDYELSFKKNDGEVFNMAMNARLILDSNGEPNHIDGMLRNITKRKKAELKLILSEEKHRALIENITDTIILINEKLELIYQSPSFIRTAGISLEELSDTSVLQFIHPEELLSFQDTFQRANSMPGVPLQFQYRIRHKKGYYIWIEGTVSNLVGNESVKAFVVNYRDITERKLMELEKQKIITDMLQRNRDLEQFAYIVSHNLRAPVANILGLTSLLSDTDVGFHEREKMTQSLNLTVKRLDVVIKDLNQILQMKREISENKETVRFSELLNDVKLSIADLIQTEQVYFISDFSAVDEINTIKSYLHSIFYNLISNSIKYRQPDISPVIMIRSALFGNKIRLTFKDNSLGIDLEKRGEQVFGLYKRFHTHAEGKGMGLYMVKTQVETLGGTISVNSEVNKGTEFKIELNIKQYD